MAGYEVLEFLNTNSLRSYPIREGLSATDTTGQFVIPTQFIVDFNMSATTSVATRFFISKIVNNFTSVVVEISDNSNIIVGTFSILFSSHTEYNDYYLTVSDPSYTGANAKLTVDDVSVFTNLPTGTFLFTLATSELEPRTSYPTLNGVSQVTVTDTQGNSFSLSGNVTIVARNNLRFRYDNVSGVLYLDAGNGLGLNTTCTLTNCIERINGVAPDPVTGNFTLLGVDCTAISNSAPGTLTIDDTCCTPCSGCTELSELTNRVTGLEAKYLDLSSFYTTLNTQLSTYLSTINSSCSCPTS
jgi:hypothetical protein